MTSHAKVRKLQQTDIPDILFGKKHIKNIKKDSGTWPRDQI
jgi:hypothetical protein